MAKKKKSEKGNKTKKNGGVSFERQIQDTNSN